MRPFVEKYRAILLDVTGNLFILGLISLILHHFTSIIVSVWIDISLLAIITFTLGFSWFFIFMQKDEEYFKIKTEKKRAEEFDKKLTFLRSLKFTDSTSNQNGLEDNDYIFLIGLGLFILFLLIEHPMTPSFAYSILLFGMAFSMLLISILPDYLTSKSLENKINGYKSKKINVFVITCRDFLNGNSFQLYFLTGTIVGIIALVFYFFGSNNLTQFWLGIAYGLFMKLFISAEL